MNDADTLQKITIPIESTNVCRNAYKEYLGEDASDHAQVHLDRNICAGGEEGNFKYRLHSILHHQIVFRWSFGKIIFKL